MTDFEFHSLKKTHLSPLVRKIWLITSIIICVLLAILFLPWQQTVEGKGVVLAQNPTQRDYSIIAPIDGFISDIYVTENQYVTKGTKLLTMVDLDQAYAQKLQNIQESLGKQSQNIEKKIVNLQTKKENLQVSYETGVTIYTQKYNQAKNRLDSLQYRQTALQKRYEIDKLNYERIDSLYKEGIESKRNFEVAQNRYIQSKTSLERGSLEIKAQQEQLSIINNEKIKFTRESKNKIQQVRNRLLEANNSLKNIEQKLQNNSVTMDRYKRGDIFAQKNGYVMRILQNDKNRYIKKGEQLLLFSPKTKEKILRIKVSDFNMPLVKEGLPVRIMFYGWPTMQISGWPAIKFGTFKGEIYRVENTSHEQGFFYALVRETKEEPWPQGDNLRIGTQARVLVRLNIVPIWYQLWRLMNALPPQMRTPVIEKKK
ncbi:MAG TPA: HlyD family efflux transporter periplasmic adaptor subunit [Sulfurimonas autotrophica]|nr:HlyD family efflux transporter periplasmic adaptor subunit [Sulfurimonas autotrophica]